MMHIEYHKRYSGVLGRDMETKLYGEHGPVFLVFPTSGGRFYEYEDFGMIEAVAPFIEAGRARFFALDSLDNETWLNSKIPHPEKVRGHNRYESYVVEEALPLVWELCGQTPLFTTGCSLGAYHAADFVLRRPELFAGALCLSGVYSLKFALGDYMDAAAYYHSPLNYLPGLLDPRILADMRKLALVLCVGQGAYEEECLAETLALSSMLRDKAVPHTLDVWGFDVNHDWPWWRKMAPHFLEKLV